MIKKIATFICILAVMIVVGSADSILDLWGI